MKADTIKIFLRIDIIMSIYIGIFILTTKVSSCCAELKLIYDFPN